MKGFRTVIVIRTACDYVPTDSEEKAYADAIERFSEEVVASAEKWAKICFPNDSTSFVSRVVEFDLDDGDGDS